MARRRRVSEPSEPAPTPTRSGERWESAECHQLIDELRNGVTLEDIARQHGRSVGGITSRVKLMLPRDEEVRSSKAADWLREALADGYDWEAVLEANMELDGYRYWRAEHDLTLRNGWQTATPLVDLARQVGGDELQVVRR